MVNLTNATAVRARTSPDVMGDFCGYKILTRSPKPHQSQGSHDALNIHVIGLNPIVTCLEAVMRTTQQFSITLPNEMADAVKSKVATGEYATESEVIRDGLRVLMARDRIVESWLRGEVAETYDVLKADRSQAVSTSQVRARLAAAHEKATAAAKA